MGRFNGAKAQQKRERNLKKKQDASKANSILKTKDAAMTIQCAICKTPFMGNSGKVVLQQHADSKHPKLTFDQCFPEKKEAKQEEKKQPDPEEEDDEEEEEEEEQKQ